MSLVVPAVRLQQPIALPSLPDHNELPIDVKIFAGSVHGDEALLCDARSFMGLCARQPNSLVWQELFGKHGVIECDVFVAPQNQGDVSVKSGAQLKSEFSTSPIGLLQCL